ncbi:hypothetical protein CAC42_2951 [Sphaceloma murrayae]|uniref:Uncharacterized protein n=1 Tax=Sphaceloma murrayae TaxID=2082308 RepID=A0A2K1R0A8_9PEZI|nr:hypothetical protein CAC42_2951 [Sphaceloma murrayae]
MGFLTTLRSKYELYRLEQRYTRRETRTTFKSGAVYVDGEYIYQNGPPVSPGEGPSESGPWSPRNGSGGSLAGSSTPGSPMSGSGSGSANAGKEETRAPWGR